jgi:hypothetical protein
MKRVKESEYGDVLSIQCVNMERWNLSKSFQEGEWGKRENNGRDEPNWGTIYVHIDNVTTKLPVQLLYTTTTCF